MRGVPGERVRLGTLLAVLVAVALTACSGTKAETAASEAAHDSASATGEGAGVAPSTTAPKKSNSLKKGAVKSGTPTTTTAGGTGPTSAGKDAAAAAATESDPTKRTMQIDVVLQEKCVRPGGTQTITVKAPHGTAAGYDTYYADGKSGLHEGFYGGNFVGWTDESDTWTHTWTVAATAPPGQAVVVVLATHNEYGRGESGDLFVVADPLGLCDPPKYADE